MMELVFSFHIYLDLGVKLSSLDLYGDSQFLLPLLKLDLGVVVHAFDPSTREVEAGGFLSVQRENLLYRVSSRTGSKTTQKNLVSEEK